MNVSTNNALWFFLIIASLAFSGWYFASKAPRYTMNDKSLNESIDNRIINLDLKQYNAQGQLAHRLKTPLMTHVPNGDVNHFTQPRITIMQEKQEPWNIQSQEGTSQKGGEKIIFKNQVKLTQKLVNTDAVNYFETEELSYFPKDKMAETSKDIHYVQPGAVVDATGLKAWLNEKRVQLLSNARGIYAPAQA